MNKLKEFNIELSALLVKYQVQLQIQQGIVVVPNKMEEENIVVPEEATATEPTPEVGETTGTEAPAVE